MGPIWDAELRVWDAKNFGLVSPGTHRNKFVKKSLEVLHNKALTKAKLVANWPMQTPNNPCKTIRGLHPTNHLSCPILYYLTNLHHSYRSTDRHFKLSRLHNRLSANRFNFALLQLITHAYNCNRSVCPERNAKKCGLATISNPEHL